ncbi:NADPH:quinone oxidoreductase family protein [Gordonia hydrophobica]|uniref:NADPH:quinone oxidoreductase family protein n=1 Tax=Gordonia hydrophobica TaxID=40516 RepID=A0ABZ2U288_9ACTN|nr:NADPH:quinone oxidoreductase family protein [Gordonia hydrophobica]MBM7366886.1 NADPH2:quinone reductase [Gordonia hydrophobica]
MHAVQLVEAVGPDGLRLVEVDEPHAADGRVVVDLAAAGVSFPDLLRTMGSYQMVADLPCVLGVEGAGVVRSAPPGSGVREGDRVAVLALDGAWQQTVTLDPTAVFPLPDGVSLAAAAGIVMNYLTVHFALDERARCRAGEVVLVHGAAGGIGVAALRVASALGLTTIAVVSNDAKAAVAEDNGADHVVRVDGFKDAVKEITVGRGVDIVIDPVGGDRFTDSLRSLAIGGRAVVLGFTGGSIPTVKVNRLLMNNGSVVGAGWGEYIRVDPGYPSRQWAALHPLLESGDLGIPEPTVLSMDRAADALRLLESRTSTGKIVLDLRSDAERR